ncbi:hypothetical protein Tsp_12217 [Trichinella spiralis]|uniref:hypothetical protein n=1 Tax=Trichinella spiralis TaxID=6334 RepID=UPI0001EFE8BF|nr:hypothetical protein Tsp_12217 [Trichinella spiralis]
MHECHYICAPPLVATNKVTDHKRGILQYCMINLFLPGTAALKVRLQQEEH